MVRLVVVVVCAAAAVGQAEQVIYVDAAATGTADGSSWSDAFTTLQDGLAAASSLAPPVEVRIAQGVYRPDQGTGVTTGDLLATFTLFDGLVLRGGYAGAAGADQEAWDPDRYATVLSGELNADSEALSNTLDNSRTIVTGSLVDSTVVVEGLTITGARSEGMLIDRGRPTIRRCRFTANGSRGLNVRDASPPAAPYESEGNTTRLYGDAGSPNVVDCHFEGNHDAGAEGHEGCTLTMTNCSFVASEDCGIRAWRSVLVLNGCIFRRNRLEGVECMNCDVTLTDCEFTENGGIAVNSGVTGSHDVTGDIPVNTYGGTLDLLRCSFVNNAGGVDAGGTVTARSCVFNGNGPAPAFFAMDDTGDATVIDCRFNNNSAEAGGPRSGVFVAYGDVVTAERCVFQGNSTFGLTPWRAGPPVYSSARVTKLSGCLFAGNSGGPVDPGAVLVKGRVMRAVNCTFADNRGRPNSFAHRTDAEPITQVKQCILWDGPASFDLPASDGGEVSVTYCDIEDSHPGLGNVSVDPEFVARGAWVDPNDLAVVLGPDTADAVWAPGDYHLKSEAGHWDLDREGWVLDEVTTPCIDLGDPNGPLGYEPFPNGGYVNLGAYGGTTQASRSYFGEPVCETQIAGDINGDCRIDDLDMEIMLSHWMMEDIGVGNLPPTLRIVWPEDGAVLDSSQPLVVRFEASDPDGQVLVVRYSRVLTGEHVRVSTGAIERPTEAGWVHDYGKSHILENGVYVLHAEALDDDGALTVVDPITMTLNR
jgi:hypothetical protein